MADYKLTKADIIDSIYQQTNISRKDIHTVFDSIIIEIDATKHIVDRCVQSTDGLTNATGKIEHQFTKRIDTFAQFAKCIGVRFLYL